jgi:AraC-like DNA-binding protein/tetratricopeptide (TPR) repeat protein
MPFRVVFAFFFCVFIFSCRSNREHETILLQEAEDVVDRDPSLALSLTDSALSAPRGRRLTDKLKVSYLLVRQRAFSKLGLMDSVLSTGVRIREKASITGDSLSMAKSLLHVRGEISMIDQKAIEPFLSGAVRSFASKRMTYEEAVIEALIGGMGSRKGDFNASMVHLYRARDILEGMDSVRPLYSVYMNIGNNRSGMGDQRASIGFYRKASDLARKLNDSIRLATALMNEGIAFSEMNIFDSSRMMFNEGLSLLPAQDGTLAGLQILFNLATLSQKQGQLSAAEAEYQRVLDRAKQIGDPVAIGMANAAIAVIMGETGRVTQAIRLLEETIRDLDNIGFRHYDMEFTNALVSLYKKNGRFSEALEASENLKKLSDSLLSVENQTVVRELEAKYQSARKETENLKLRQDVRNRNLIAIGLLLAVVALFVLIMVMRQRNHYHRALNRTYERLLSDYRRQRDEEKVPNVPQGPENSLDDRSLSEEPVGEGEGAPLDASETLTSEEDMALFDHVMSVLKTRQPHLERSFKLEDIANQLGISSRKLSQVIKLATGHSFTQFINRLRIDEATRLMERPNAGPLKIDAIAGMCGFSNRQHFRRVFEQVTGVTPGYFRKSVDDPASE